MNDLFDFVERSGSTERKLLEFQQTGVSKLVGENYDFKLTVIKSELIPSPISFPIDEHGFISMPSVHGESNMDSVTFRLHNISYCETDVVLTIIHRKSQKIIKQYFKIPGFAVRYVSAMLGSSDGMSHRFYHHDENNAYYAHYYNIKND